MSQRTFIKRAVATAFAAAGLLVASAVSAVDPSNYPAGTMEYYVPVSAACHPSQGPCQRVVIAGEAKGTIAPEERGPFDRSGIGSSCHPAYTPSWLTCSKSARATMLAELSR